MRCYGLTDSGLTDRGGVAMNMRNDDIGAGIFVWSFVSFITMSFAAISSWAMWG